MNENHESENQSKAQVQDAFLFHLIIYDFIISFLFQEEFFSHSRWSSTRWPATATGGVKKKKFRTPGGVRRGGLQRQRGELRDFGACGERGRALWRRFSSTAGAEVVLIHHALKKLI